MCGGLGFFMRMFLCECACMCVCGGGIGFFFTRLFWEIRKKFTRLFHSFENFTRLQVTRLVKFAKIYPASFYPAIFSFDENYPAEVTRLTISTRLYTNLPGSSKFLPGCGYPAAKNYPAAVYPATYNFTKIYPAFGYPAQNSRVTAAG